MATNLTPKEIAPGAISFGVSMQHEETKRIMIRFVSSLSRRFS
jgi:hypothetical protein